MTFIFDVDFDWSFNSNIHFSTIIFILNVKMSSPTEGAAASRASMAMAESEPGTPNGTERDVSEQRRETLREREEYLAGVQRRVEAYENCVAAITAATTSLQELSGHLDAMQLATQQLNAFTGGWLAVWKRPSA
ncbi:hypothetical protein PHYBOEH_005148 [Phytophthora boehmeriae]|uniref:Uncharacterized protein n=1 Tax=Phytophthora boehmeriae TaxID=109152 RepID=A0A8T1WKP8_9STRA|nr:hypothetical protein PHYBOEH_005148 [Phytophthora boehmeriae]